MARRRVLLNKRYALLHLFLIAVKLRDGLLDGAFFAIASWASAVLLAVADELLRRSRLDHRSGALLVELNCLLGGGDPA